MASVLLRPLQLRLRTCIPHQRRWLGAMAATGPTTPLQVDVDGKLVRVRWTDGQTPALAFHHVWLRDHCTCEQCFHPVTQQRLVDTYLIPENIAPASVEPTNNGDALVIKWNDTERHRSVYSLGWLKKHAYDTAKAADDIFNKRILWETAAVAAHPPSVEYTDVMHGDKGLYRWLENIATFGFSFVQGVPVSVEATEALARRITFIRGFWDFKPDLVHADTAYTTLGLNVHTDTTYFSDPVGLQMFHLIEFTGKGGNTLLVDGFRVAKEMRERWPADYEALCTIPVASQYLDKKNHIDLRPLMMQPIFVRNPQTHELTLIRYNNDDRAPLTHLNASQVEAFYRAHRSFNKLIRDPQFEYRLQLHPGQVLLFDNQRILHGRTSFTGHRRLIGCYLNGDDYRSRFRGLAELTKAMPS